MLGFGLSETVFFVDGGPDAGGGDACVAGETFGVEGEVDVVAIWRNERCEG